MDKRKVAVKEMMAEMFPAMKEAGCSEPMLWGHYYYHFRQIERFFAKQNLIYYDPDVADEFLQIQRNRKDAKEISEDQFSRIKCTVQHLNNFYYLNTFFYSPFKKGTVFMVSPENEKLIGSFIEYRKYKENTRDDVEWVLRKYISYMEKKGHPSLESVSVEDARHFILEMTNEMKLSSIKNVMLYLKYFYRYLKEIQYPTANCIEVFSYKIIREMPIQGYVTDDELDRILAQIDRSTPTGKRDYAIIQLAATTGIRAIDLIRLKISDIDWTKKTLHFVQQKTGREIYLPIVEPAGGALADYLLHGRPRLDYPEVFLRVVFPIKPLTNAVAIGNIFIGYQRKAGIQRSAFDGKGFHGLRRRLAKKLIECGISLELIAQILGHANVYACRQYLSLNTSQLKECALNFTGIPCSFLIGGAACE